MAYTGSARLAALVATLYLSTTCAFALPDIAFVTQPPNPEDFATANSTFGSHLATLDSIPRGGDLYIRYSDGTLKNVTAAAGFGVSGFQNAQGIAVRDPSVHWDGNKILFSMVIGAPTQRYQVNTYNWQLYEATNLGKNQTPVITKVPNQPAKYNNVMGTYASDDRIIFVSDHPLNALSHTYPQRDEYESTATNTGLWSLDPQSGIVKHLDHAPSGDFSPSVDSFGRVIFTRWDHLQRDQQNRCSLESFGAFNFASESNGAAKIDSDAEVYPEPRGACENDRQDDLNLHSFNHFMPWMMNQDGTELETINHVGRHELVGYLSQSFNNDPNLMEYYGQYPRTNQYSVANLFQLAEDPLHPGRYYATNGPEFRTHASGQIVRFDAPPSRNPDQISVTSITHPDTASYDDAPSAQHIGLTRDPAPLSDGALVAAHTSTTLQDANIGTPEAPQSRYAFRLKAFAPNGQYFTPHTTLTNGITETISFWSPDNLITYTNVVMWELQPKEIKATTRPTATRESPLPQPESQILSEEGVTPQALRDFLLENDLALIISRNITSRDKQDHQQPTNLKVANSSTRNTPHEGHIYEVARLQIFQGDLIRGYGGLSEPTPGRRVIAQPLHSVDANPVDDTAPSGSVSIAPDGSVAAFVPARRALTYQLTDPAGKGVVRERFWLTFQPGEVRVCGSCHGVNTTDQSGNPAPENAPEALRALLQHWKQQPRITPQIKLTVKTTRTARRAATKSKAVRLRLSLQAKNTRAHNKNFSIEATAGKIACGEVLKATTNSDGAFSTLSRPLALTKGPITFRFKALYGGTNLDSTTMKLKGSATTNLKSSRICEAIRRALRSPSANAISRNLTRTQTTQR